MPWRRKDAAISEEGDLEIINAMPEEQRDTIVETVPPNTMSGMEETLATLRRVAEAG